MEWLLNQLKSESELILKAPLAFAVFVMFGIVLGYVIATWYSTRQIAENSGRDGAVVVAEILEKSGGFGYDARNDEFVDLVKYLSELGK